MDTLKYVVKRLLMALLILFGVSVIIFSLSRMMPSDYIDKQYASQIGQGTMKQEDVDRIKDIYGLYMPDAYVSVQITGGDSQFKGKTFTKRAKHDTYDRLQDGVGTWLEFYEGSYDAKGYRVYLNTEEVGEEGYTETVPSSYEIYKVITKGFAQVPEETPDEGEEDDEDEPSGVVTVEEVLELVESGTYAVNEENGKVTFTSSAGNTFDVNMKYRVATFWNKAGAVLSSYFTWLGNLLKGDLGMSFKYRQPVGKVISENMGISFGISFVATILQFAIAIPLGIKAATHQYGVIDYTVTVLTMIGISLPTFFLSAVFILVFSVNLGWFPIGGLHNSLPVDASGALIFGDMLWHLILPMLVLVILSVGSLMRYTRTNTLEVLNADYIRTARAKGLSEKTVIYKHAFRNTMIPLVTLMASILPSLFGGAMITETVFAIPGIGKLAYDALLVADVPFIMGYNMFLAIMTVLGTLLSDLMYAVVDPRVKLGK